MESAKQQSVLSLGMGNRGLPPPAPILSVICLWIKVSRVQGTMAPILGCIPVIIGGLCGARWDERGQGSLTAGPSVPTRGGFAKGRLYCLQHLLVLIHNSNP